MIAATDPSSLPLRDIHLPVPVSWWPLAPGWWIVIILCGLIIAAGIYILKRRRDYFNSAIYLAKKDLESIKDDYRVNRDKKILIKALSALLRRVGISVHDRRKTAALTGPMWLHFLDHYTADKAFSRGVGSVLIHAPYQAEPEFDGDALIRLTSSWIDSVAERHRGNGA